MPGIPDVLPMESMEALTVLIMVGSNAKRQAAPALRISSSAIACITSQLLSSFLHLHKSTPGLSKVCCLEVFQYLKDPLVSVLVVACQCMFDHRITQKEPYCFKCHQACHVTFLMAFQMSRGCVRELLALKLARGFLAADPTRASGMCRNQKPRDLFF